jgi:two-component system heavy metal sensor histidine kinase CusS
MSALAQPPKRPQVRLWVALDISRQTATLQSYRHWLTTGVALGVLVAVLSTGYLARHALRPLAQMQDRVSRLKVDELSTRLGQQNWPLELQPLALEFDRLLEEVSQGLERLSSFSADLAHELRTPLTSLILTCEVTLRQTRTQGQYEEVLSSNMEELERLSSLVDRLLLLARTEASRGQINCAPLALAPLLERLIDFYLSDIEPVQLLVPPDLQVVGELRLIEISVGNILSNARKYARPPFEVRWTGEHLEIADSGPGIEAYHLPHLFERLYRVDSSRQQSQPGYGLGLALVQSAMKVQGGQVEVNSSPEGTIFRLTFAKL